MNFTKDICRPRPPGGSHRRHLPASIPGWLSQNTSVGIDPASIKQAIEMIDSARLALIGFEPKEPGYQPDANPLGVPTRESFDSAAVTWGTFVRLCREDRFKEAYDLYNEDGKYGDLIVSMQHPGNLYILCRDVLKPMMYEFEPKDSADVKYTNLMKVEYYLRLVNI